MKTSILACLFLAATALAVTGCDADPDNLLGGRDPNAGPGGSSGDPNDPANQAALECTVQPPGRTYAHFDGTSLVEQRINENVGVNRARVKPYAVMAGEYKRVLGAAPPSLAGAAASFDDPPARWFAEATHSGVSLNAIFEISFDGCRAYVKTDASLAAAPTAASAEAFCSSFMRKAWNQTPSPEEIDGCVKLATEKLTEEKDIARKWTYVCASVLSSSHFLTY